MGIFFGNKKIKIRLKHTFAILMATLFCFFMLIYPEASIISARKGINIWINNILPVMFPFFICANFMNNLGVTSYLKPGAFAFSMSILSGYPMGAKILGDMCRKGIVDEKECKSLMSFCTTSGPAFLLGTIGTSMIGNHICGLVIMIAHYIGAIINGFIFSFAVGREPRNRGLKNKKVYEKQYYDDILEALTNAIGTSFKSMGVIMAYVIMFMMLTDALQMIGLFDFIKNPLYLGMTKGMLEMTIGCAILSGNVAISMLEQTIGCCMLVSFGGLSIIGQSMSMLSGTNISIFYLLLVKIFHGLIAGVIAYLLMVCFFV